MEYHKQVVFNCFFILTSSEKGFSVVVNITKKTDGITNRGDLRLNLN